jgi:polyisoprenoid-binding protein YceI
LDHEWSDPLKSYLSLFLFVSVVLNSSAFSAPKKVDSKLIAAASPVPTLPMKKGQDFSVANGTLEFFAIGKPSMLKIHGESTAMTGTLTRDVDTVTGAFEIPLNSFETGMSVRNNHLKEKVFETSKFDKSKLTITKLTLPAGKTGELKDLPFTGKLNLHGVDKDVSGTATVMVGDKTLGFSAQFEVKLSDFQIPPPEFMGMTMQDVVKVSAKGDGKAAN